MLSQKKNMQLETPNEKNVVQIHNFTCFSGVIRFMLKKKDKDISSIYYRFAVCWCNLYSIPIAFCLKHIIFVYALMSTHFFAESIFYWSGLSTTKPIQNDAMMTWSDLLSLWNRIDFVSTMEFHTTILSGDLFTNQSLSWTEPVWIFIECLLERKKRMLKKWRKKWRREKLCNFIELIPS